jgi:hypothetical protein
MTWKSALHSSTHLTLCYVTSDSEIANPVSEALLILSSTVILGSETVPVS